MSERSGTSVLTDVLESRMTAVEAKLSMVGQTIKDHEIECADERTTMANKNTDDVKATNKWLMSLMITLVAVAFSGGGLWIATINQVSENERVIIQVEALQTVNTASVRTLVRNQQVLGQGQEHLVSQMEEIVVADQEGRKARIIRNDRHRLEPVGPVTDRR